MPVVAITEDQHILIRTYCAMNGKKINIFIAEMIRDNKDLNHFKKSLETLKFKG